MHRHDRERDHGPGAYLRGEVILPAYTFVATAHAFRCREIVPVFADMEPRNHNLDLASIERLITPIVGTHVWARPARARRSPAALVVRIAIKCSVPSLGNWVSARVGTCGGISVGDGCALHKQADAYPPKGRLGSVGRCQRGNRRCCGDSASAAAAHGHDPHSATMVAGSELPMMPSQSWSYRVTAIPRSPGSTARPDLSKMPFPLRSPMQLQGALPLRSASAT